MSDGEPTAAGGRSGLVGALERLALTRTLLFVTVCAAIAGTLWASITLGDVPDPTLFTNAADELWSGGWADVFADSYLQIGPAYLAVLGLTNAVADLLHVAPELVVAAVMSTAIGAATVLLTRDALALAGRVDRRAELGAGLTVVLASPLCATAWSGHFEELVTALLLLAAAHLTTRSHLGWAGLLIGLAAATKMWGLLGIGILLVAPAGTERTGLLRSITDVFTWSRFRPIAVGVAATLATLAVAYLPFVVVGHVATFDKTWIISTPSPIALIGDNDAYGFALRGLQGAAAVVAGALVALLARGDVRVLWTVPAAVVATRLLLDPFLQAYYTGPLLLLVAVGVWSMSRQGQYVVALVVSASMPIVWALTEALTGTAGSVVTTVVLVGLLAACVRTACGPRSRSWPSTRRRRRTPDPTGASART